MAKILVTGGLGFIGAEFVNANAHAHDIVVLDKFTYAADINRLGVDAVENAKIIKGDINNIHKLAEQHPELSEVEYVVNFAAESHVDNSIQNSAGTYKSNLTGVIALLDFYKDKGLTKFVQISTDEVYGDMASLRNPIDGHLRADESFSLRPSSPYSASKAGADLAVMSYARTFDLPYLITRSCNNFGPHQHPEKLIPLMFKKIAAGEKIPLYGNGQQRREWIHVADNVEIISRLTFSKEIVNEIMNIGSGYNYRNIQIIEMLRERMGSKTVSYEHIEDRPGHDKAYSLNCCKLQSYLGDDYAFLPLETFLHGMVTCREFKDSFSD